MTNKVQKIREEVARIQLYTQSEVLKQVLDYIDKVQEEPVSIWHNASEKSVKDIPILFYSTFDNKWYVFNYSKDINWNVVDKWAYVDELLKL